jgi:hypothetical protein
MIPILNLSVLMQLLLTCAEQKGFLHHPALCLPEQPVFPSL